MERIVASHGVEVIGVVGGTGVNQLEGLTNIRLGRRPQI